MSGDNATGSNRHRRNSAKVAAWNRDVMERPIPTGGTAARPIGV